MLLLFRNLFHCRVTLLEKHHQSMRLAHKEGLTDNEIFRVVSPLTRAIGLSNKNSPTKSIHS